MSPAGFNVETVEYKNISFTVWDVGGQDKVRCQQWALLPAGLGRQEHDLGSGSSSSELVGSPAGRCHAGSTSCRQADASRRQDSGH